MLLLHNKLTTASHPPNLLIIINMKKTKEDILEQLLLLHTATIQQLADSLELSGIAVRHHLLDLEAEGVVASSEERHGVGRPRFIYRLTDEGYRNAPTDYGKLSETALDTLSRVLGSDRLLEVCKEFGIDIAAGYTSAITAREPDQVLAQVAANLAPHGFIFTWVKSGEKYTLTTHHCSFHYLGQKHPEVCSINQALLESLTRQSLSHETCIHKGDAVCTYTCEVKNGE